MKALGKFTNVFSVMLLCTMILLVVQPVLSQSTGGQSMIAFVTADYDTRQMTISLVDPATGAVTTLLNDGIFNFPVLSPDGRSLAFIGEHPRTGSSNLYIIGTDGTGLRPLLGNRPVFRPVGQVVWSADSSQLVYGVLDRSRRPLGFDRTNVDGTGAERIPFDLPGRLWDSWIGMSPDGSQLAVLIELIDAPYHQILLTDANGENGQLFTGMLPDGTPVDRIAWSPDGTQTVLSTILGSGPQPEPLMVGDANGENAEVIVQAPPNAINSPSWSPDGERIAFVATESSAAGNP